MRALFPVPAASVDLAEAYAYPAGAGNDRPFVRCNMISTLDGAIALDGRSGSLGGPADRKIFRTLRSLADVVLVGAGTVRSEKYGPARLDDELRRQRAERGQSEVPPIAVVTRSANLDWSSPFFTEAEARPIVFTTGDSEELARPRAAGVADVLVAGEDRVEPLRLLEHLHRAGYGTVLLEGGPGLNADFAKARLLDELCLSLSPLLVGGEGPGVFAGPGLHEPLELAIVQLLEEDGFLFCRLAVRALGAGS